ncbi:MAG: endolytic transglycosylase MltG, partial [Patescibacteria group bacterium]
EARHGRQETGNKEQKAVIKEQGIVSRKREAAIRKQESVRNEQKSVTGDRGTIRRKQESVRRGPEAKIRLWGASLKKYRTILLLVLCSLLAIIVAAGAYATFTPLAAPRARADLDIPAGSSSRAIGELLKSHGVIRSKWAFVTYATLAGNATDLHAGSYTFDGPVTIAEITRQLVRGERYPNERVITVPEGWDMRDLGRYFRERNLFEADTWWATVGLPARDYRGTEAPLPDFSGEFSFLKDRPAYAGLEGYLYPDTYRIFRDATAEDVAKKMLANFDRKLSPELRAEIVRQKKTIFEVVTVASLIEKEVVDEHDRRIAAGILWKRLSSGMPLQVDASVNYVTGKRETPSAEDLAIDSPFNTYRSSGLPLGPIANPGIEAILAAIFPQENPYLYYLTAPGGKTIFSLTFEEHVAAKARYLH